MFDDKNKVRSLILEEYPTLKTEEISIIKQFVSPAGREYNTFLIQSKEKIFVAKGVTGKTASVSNLETEWIVLSLLDGKNVPKLIYKDHKPQNYLLIEYIEGDSAADLLKNNSEQGKIFSLIGEALGKIHTINVNNFGQLNNPLPVVWSKYIATKYSERLAGAKTIINKDLYNKTDVAFHSLEPLLLEEDRDLPVINHRDVYSENFIIKKDYSQAVLIDFAMAIGGRPLFDVAKLFTTELINKPQFKSNFLETYTKFVSFDRNFSKKLTLYIILECLGFIGFNEKTNNPSGRDSGVETLNRVVKEEISL